MKTVTCKQLGGPCDTPLHAATADEIIKAQDAHLKETAARGDSSHESARREMKARWRKPLSAMRWYKQAKSDFAVLPDD